ncbi:hypothetical protein DLM45_15745 [Hyphomicrobium methylovorum]|uniref:hypothetical protein n=1 Tax=Hyphomicrobium methylovorum TaxID=84 RepID=UPI0015E69D5F|nr:hypothetical protein [Hyphomicrobium methylovorum]MBA2127664.1 hypothetical protein [Hyphomicrobium methylovorum]
MTRLHQNVEELLARLTEDSQGEMELVRALGDAIRRVDEQLLREVRTVTVQHEMRREAILGELQTLAGRLCVLPAPSAQKPSVTAIDQQARYEQQAIDRQPRYETQEIDAPHNVNGGADWRQATQNISDDFEFTFNEPRH